MTAQHNIEFASVSQEVTERFLQPASRPDDRFGSWAVEAVRSTIQGVTGLAR